MRAHKAIVSNCSMLRWHFGPVLAATPDNTVEAKGTQTWEQKTAGISALRLGNINFTHLSNNACKIRHISLMHVFVTLMQKGPDPTKGRFIGLLRMSYNTRSPSGPTHKAEILRLLTRQAESTTKLPCRQHHPASAHSLLHSTTKKGQLCKGKALPLIESTSKTPYLSGHIINCMLPLVNPPPWHGQKTPHIPCSRTYYTMHCMLGTLGMFWGRERGKREREYKYK